MDVMDIGKWARGRERSLVARVGKALIKQGKKCLPPVRSFGSDESDETQGGGGGQFRVLYPAF